MGADSSTYVGVYLIVPYKKITTTSSYYITETGEKTKNKFCPNTGKEHKLVNETKDKMEPSWTEFEDYDSLTDEEIDELDNDTFWCPQWTKTRKETNIFLLNMESEFKLANEDDTLTLDLSNTDISLILTSFNMEYKKYLNAIKKEYGNVYVKFGVVHYHN